MFMFAETFGNKKGKISTYEHGGISGVRLLDVREVTRCDVHTHEEAVRCAARHLYDVNLGIKDLVISATGKKMNNQHYAWIVVITRRTTRTRV